MEYAIGYVAIIFVMQALAAIRTPNQDCLAVIIGSVFWPFFLILVAGSLILDAIGWDFDIVRNDKMVYFRKPTNPKARGFAITLLTLEFQFYKAKA